MHSSNSEYKELESVKKRRLDDLKLLNEVNTLSFLCDKCKNRWTMEQPKKTWVRSGGNTNFFIKRCDEHSKHTYIHCPKCVSTKFIRRIAPRIRPTSEPQRTSFPKPMKYFELYE